ncbi:ClpP-like prohead protease/major capsid protein fusion protein [Thiopseudomonas alkaliphila]|uniref:ClpP-like prohead protease/major capsid protein fusion protein n=1 Tax=Thiopseudomonas alkaliphila TaxID=1697053 RepID=UPI002575C4D4|nr:ClpP-like prohead protease/major capsid protein fusion protein [Thiopseudomonas alkaliphila]MDM1707703.1 Clp protease ClpP [Thiopseudomonas alkaliphila]
MDIQIYDVIDDELAKIVQTLAASAGTEEIDLLINSPGGGVTAALAIYSVLRAHKGKVTARVHGLCASAATVVMLAADEIILSEHSLLMVHNPWTAAEGDSNQMRKVADDLDKHSQAMAELYAERTGLSIEEIMQIMAAETWYTAPEAVAAGFAHSIDSHSEAQAKPRMTAKALAYYSSIIKQPEAVAACRERLAAFQQIKINKAANNKLLNMLAMSGGNSKLINNFKQSEQSMNQKPEQLRNDILTAMGTHTTPTAVNTHAYADNGAIVRDGMIDALSTRLGLAKAQDKRNPFRTMSLMDLARASLSEKGVSMSGFGSKMQVVGAAFTHSTSDFGSVLMDVTQKAMMTGWESSGETFQEWTKAGVLTNFHTAHRVGMSGFPSLPKVPEGAEYKYVSTDDRGAPIALATYGGLFGITRQAIINDDLSAFSTIPNSLGRAASRTIGDLVYSVLTSNADFVDGAPLFSAAHGNHLDAASLDPQTLGKVREQMRLQQDSQGNTLNITPAFVIVPAALESQAIQVLNSTSLPGAEMNSGIINPVNNMGQLIVESRLDASAKDTWYIAAGQGSDTVEVAYLDGMDTPYLEQQEGWTVDGVSFKVRIDAGVAPLDYRGLARVSPK